jgi:sugar phosphate isomerase/epimerase
VGDNLYVERAMQRYSISTYIVQEAPRAEALALIAGAGFTLVELGCDPGHLGDWYKDPAAMRRELAALGLTPASLHIPTVAWDVANPDAAARRVALDAARATFDLAAEVGAEAVICHPNASTHPYSEETFDAETARSRESVVEMAGYAAEAGVRMALENLPARHTPRPGTTIGEVLAMIDDLGDHVGVCLDAGHSNANGYSAADEVREAGARLLALHIQDNDGQGDDQHILPGRGTTDWEAFLDALDDIDFAGLRTFEVGPHVASPEDVAALCALRDAWLARGR